MRLLSRRPSISPSMVVALIALAVALGGTSYAAVKLAPRSVGSKELKKGAVTRANLRDNAVNGAKIADDSLTGKDVAESSLGQVPSAATAGTADHGNASGALDRTFYRVVTGTVPPAKTDPADPTSTIPVNASATATCDAGHLAVGGGAKVEDLDLMGVEHSFPDAGGRAWTAAVASDDAGAPHSFTVYAICVPAGASG
jgi:hypothetical protein